MKTEALITMIAAQSIVTAIAMYFFYLVLTIKKKPEPDSFSENDDKGDENGDGPVWR